MCEIYEVHNSGQEYRVHHIHHMHYHRYDFFFQQSEEMVFTNTEPRTISDVKTSIHNPDGSLANLDLNSSKVMIST